MSKTRVDQLGEKLRDGSPDEGDLRELAAYRQSFEPAYQQVVAALRVGVGIEPTGRPAKSTAAIIDKLRRETVRLSQIQDVAGARLVVVGVREQDDTVRLLTETFDRTSVIDRRQQPSHGYRAVHVIVRIDDMPVEIQVRTVMQHRWAELSEKLSDILDPAVKYGGGAPEIRQTLDLSSRLISRMESLERGLLEVAQHIDSGTANSDVVQQYTETRAGFESAVTDLHQAFDETMSTLRTYLELHS